jgi:5-methylcytosine-specific restriction endonuclease McrBC regulatory subunit McrC
MKNYEQKYNEALERAREYHKMLINEDNPEWASELEKIFPELHESEDERIRKGLINYFNDFTLPTFGGLDPKKILAWLEKQGNISPTEDELEALRIAAYEPIKNWSEKLQSLYEKLVYCEYKLADKVEPKFHEGEWITIKE